MQPDFSDGRFTASWYQRIRRRVSRGVAERATWKSQL
jgi:hypothetical protein